MSTCHLESLPFVPLCRLLKAMSIYNLVQLSRTSKLWKEEIQKMRVIQSGGYKICIDEIGSSIEMSKQDCKFYWNRKEKSKLLGYVLGCYRYLSTIFPGGINHLKICPTHISDFEKIPNECQVLSIEVNGYLWDLKQGNGNEKLQIMTIQKENGKWNEEEVIEGLNTYRVGKQIYYLENYDSLIESEDFLPYHSENRICISDSYEFRRADGIRCTIEIRYSTIQIFVCNQ
ncbi:hypothetical protein L5515_001999 [Caenorhabditis briggsae]|uniref:F-box domain-containing protein n=1 Tax=Caenorhabditis briggsae TaxID=6238 RepID=A0AAE9E599_CAEBR|nr:hypothetical protein L5515_001999 [Caenorhabditis briggsae]